MELITNNNELTIKSFKNNTNIKPKSKSPLKNNNEFNLNNSLHSNIKKLSINKKYNKLKKKKTLDKFFEKYISEKLSVQKDKSRKNNTMEKSFDTKVYYHSYDKTGFYKKIKAKITKIIKNKKIVTDSFLKINKINFSEHLRIQDEKLTNSPTNETNLNKNVLHKRYPLKTINISALKSLEEKQETNFTFLNHTNTNFCNNKNKMKIKDIKLYQNTFKIKNNCPIIWQIIAFTKKYKKMYENVLKQNEELQKENEELKKKIENINDEVCILKEEDNINKEIIKENEDKMEELSNYILQQNKNNESRMDDFKYLLYKKDEEIQRLSKDLEKIDDSKRNIYINLNNELLSFKEKIKKQNEEINNYKKRIEMIQNENNILKKNTNINNVNIINNFSGITNQIINNGNKIVKNKNN